MTQHNSTSLEPTHGSGDCYPSHPIDSYKDSSVLGKLQRSNTRFRRASLNDIEGANDGNAPAGKLLIENMHFHPEEFAAFAIRAVAYADEADSGDPLNCSDHGVIRVNGKSVSWKIRLETRCGTMKSAQNEDPMTIARSLTITLPAN